jgi:hypothetical protein
MTTLEAVIKSFLSRASILLEDSSIPVNLVPAAADASPWLEVLKGLVTPEAPPLLVL